MPRYTGRASVARLRGSGKLAKEKIMSTPPINGVIETCLYSNDLSRSVRFYQEQLGLRLLESGERICVFSVADNQVLPNESVFAALQ